MGMAFTFPTNTQEEVMAMDTEIKNAVNATDKDAQYDEINVSRVRTGKGSA